MIFFGIFWFPFLANFFSKKSHGVGDGIFFVENVFDKLAKISHPKKSLIVVNRNRKKGKK